MHEGFSKSAEVIAEAYLKAPNAAASAQFGGESLALSGDTLVVGTALVGTSGTTITNGATGYPTDSTDSSVGSGAAYVFQRASGTWAAQAYLKAPNSRAKIAFGSTVAISGDTIAVASVDETSYTNAIINGAAGYSDHSSGGSVGAVYMFQRASGTWAAQAYLKAPNMYYNFKFGSGVGVSGDTVVVGSVDDFHKETTITNGENGYPTGADGLKCGAAHVFIRAGQTWAAQAYLKASNAVKGLSFGDVVGISGDTIVISAATESSNATDITNGATGYPPGNHVNPSYSRSQSGAVYVFVRASQTWAAQAYLKAVNADSSDKFGFAVAISGATIVVGSNQEDGNANIITNGATGYSMDNSMSSSGAAYVFVRASQTWTAQAYLKAPNQRPWCEFGGSVDISRDFVVVSGRDNSGATTITNGATGYPIDESGDGSGAAYLFTRANETWAAQAYIKAPNADEYDFAVAVTISGDTAVMGAKHEGSSQTGITSGAAGYSMDNAMAQRGAAYVFRVTPRIVAGNQAQLYSQG